LTAAGALVATGAGVGARVFEAGDPAPVALRSIALPHGGVSRGAALPPGVAVVQQRVEARAAQVTLRCPGGLRSIDVLRPQGARVTITYAPGSVPGIGRTAKLLLRPAPGAHGRPVLVGLLCRRADAYGSVVASSALGRGPKAIVARRSALR